jgi:hypothetical protein
MIHSYIFVTMNDSFQTVQTGQVFSKKQAIAVLSQERGRSPQHPLDPTLISRWCADLGFEKWVTHYSPDQFAQLQAVNRHYAEGGTRIELLAKMRNPQWYVSKI